MFFSITIYNLYPTDGVGDIVDQLMDYDPDVRRIVASVNEPEIIPDPLPSVLEVVGRLTRRCRVVSLPTVVYTCIIIVTNPSINLCRHPSKIAE